MMQKNVRFDSAEQPDYVPQPQATEYTPTSKHRDTSGMKNWLLSLVAVVVVIVGLGLALVQFLQSLYQDEAWFRSLVQLAVVVVVVALVGALAWCAYSVGLALYHRALRESLTSLPGGVPIRAADVSQGLAAGLSGRFLDVKQTEAANSGYRNVTSFSPSQSINYGPSANTAKPDSVVPELVAPLLEAVAPDEWLQWIDKTPHTLLAAETGGGKSTTAKAILAPRIEAGEAVYIIDPHSSDWFGLPAHGGGEDWNAVQQAMDTVFDEYQRRLDEREAHRKRTGLELPVAHFGRLTVLLDEANTTRANIDTGSKKVSNPWRRFVQVLGSGARKVNISVLLLAQSANVEDIGLSAPMRENFTRLALDSGAARKLIQLEEPDSQWRALLYGALADRSYPAVCEYKGRVYLLDRTGLDHVTPPTNAQAAAWNGAPSDLLSSLLHGTNSSNSSNSSNDVTNEVPAVESDVPAVPEITVNDEDRAEIATLLVEFPPSEVVKRLTGFHPRKYGEYRAKVDQVAAMLGQ